MKTTITNTKKQHIIAYVLLLTLTVLAVKNASAQKQASNWYLGNHAGLNIKETPYLMNDGALLSDGSCTSYSDPESGALAIYSNGNTIWNGKHIPVTGGLNIMGSPNTSQGVLMVKMPALPHFIFCFTTGVNGDDSLRYTLVDIAAFSHLGQVDPMHKNIAIAGPVEEKLTAVDDGNGNTWVIAHGYGTDEYIAIKLSGIEYPETITPVISHIGNVDNIGGKGCMKLSPDGKKIARTLPFQNKVEYANFDLATGVVSGLSTINNMTGCFGVEFSSYSNRMYITTQGNDRNFIHQFDVSLPTYNDIVTSKFSLVPPAGVYPTALQLGYDGIVYTANAHGTTLGMITNADTIGSQLIYGATANNLEHEVYNGLPAFNQSYFKRAQSTPVVTGITEDVANTISVYPNPSSGIFKLNIGDNKSRDIKLNVFNMTGAKVYSNENFEEGEKVHAIDLSRQPAGVYFFEVTTPTSQTVRRLVIN